MKFDNLIEREIIQLNKPILMEGTNQPLIIVDVQPSYDNWCSGVVDPIIEYLNESRGPALIFFNGEELDLDSKNAVIDYYLGNGLDEDKLRDIEFHEKTYAFLRDWMDEGVSDRIIIKTLREMFIRREFDSRDIPPDELKAALGNDLTPQVEGFIDDEMGIYVPLEDRVFSKMKMFRRSYLGGGGRHECLAEIKLLMDALNIRYRLVRDFIY